MNIEKIFDFLKENGFDNYRIKQISQWVFKGKVKSFNEITVLPNELRELLDNNFSFFSIDLNNFLKSKDNNAFKFVFKLKDGKLIETSLFKNIKNEWVVCVSSQVGCAVMCAFCASGKKGLKRNLDWEEIFDQVLYSRYFLVSNKIGDIKKIVFMGIGEPLMNYQNVAKTINLISSFIGIGKRNMSVSTFGYIPRIRDFAKDFPQVNLALSLHSASNEIRNKLVPFGFKYPLSQLQKALSSYIEITNKKIFIEYVLLDGINNKIKDAYKIRDFFKNISSLKYFVINLIPYNSTSSNFKSPNKENILKFQNLLLSLGIETTIRKSYAQDIKGACGQLIVSS